MAGRKLVIDPKKAHPLVVFLFTKMVERSMLLNTMSNKSGIGTNALTDWRSRTNPSVPNLDACLNVVGYKLIAVPMDFDETTIQEKKPLS